MLHSYHGFSMSMSLKPILAQICPSNFYWKLLFTLKQLKGMILLFFRFFHKKSTFKKNPCLHCNRKCISNVLQTDRQRSQEIWQKLTVSKNNIEDLSQRRAVLWWLVLELERTFAKFEVSQSQRRLRLVPSPGWKWLPLLSHLRHYAKQALTPR